jgi:dipeptidyl aminopeptidase/acylaminoacyl peptidase
MGPHGEDPRRVTLLGADTRYPEYSPDGKLIAFSSQRGVKADVLPQIWIATADGACAWQLTSKGGEHPSWSPDGQHLVFTRWSGWSNEPGDGVLWVIDIHTLEQTQLTTRWPERPAKPGDQIVKVGTDGELESPR